MTVEDWRRQIDAIDKQLVRCLNERARLATRLLATKEAACSPIYDAGREERVLEHVCSENVGPFANAALKRIFRRIIAETRRLEIEQSPYPGVDDPQGRVAFQVADKRKGEPQ